MRRLRGLSIVIAVLLLAAACSGDDSGSDGSATGSSATDDVAATTSTTEPVEPIQVLLTNDDGVGSEGIDAVAVALSERDDIELTIVAPAEQQSGTSDNTSPAPPGTEATTTLSGLDATAVDGFPADSVLYGLSDAVGIEFDLVVSGLNEGQNIGVIRNLSGTVGAAATAAREGVAALAASQGLPGEPDYESGVVQVEAWVDEHLAPVRVGSMAGTLESLNIPTCVTGEVRGVIIVPADDDNDPQGEIDCTSTLADPVDDVEAFANGFASLTQLDPAVTGQSVQ